MSAALPLLETPVAVRVRPALRLVATRPLSLGRVPFAILIGTILTSGLVTLLMLHTYAAQDAFRLERLKIAQGTLGDTEQQLALQVQEQTSPATLARRARALGMVPGGPIARVKIGRHHRIVSVTHAAPPVVIAPPPSPKPSPAATKQTKATTKPTTKHASRRAAPVRHG